MVMDSEFWSTVINSSANLIVMGAMVIQTVIFYVTFKFGFQYLRQHREKIKDERRLMLVYDAKTKLFHLRNKSIKRYEVLGDYYASGLARKFVTTKPLEDHVNEFLTSPARDEISSLIEELRSLLDFVGNNALIRDFEEYVKVYGRINRTYESFQSIVSQGEDADAVFEAFHRIPTSFVSQSFPPTAEAEKLFQKIQLGLKAEYFK